MQPNQVSDPSVPIPAGPATSVADPASPDLAPTDASLQSKGLTVFVNTTASYLLTYQLCTFVYQYVQVFQARREYVLGQWTAGGVHFSLPDSAWTYSAVINVYSASPLLMLLAGALSFVLFWKWLRFHRGMAKLLMLWLCFHATNYLLGGLLADAITQNNSAYVPNWLLGSGVWAAMALGVLAAVVQIGLGFALSVPFLLAHESRTLLRFDNRKLFIRYTIIWPWLASSALLVVSRLPLLTTNEVLHYAAMGLLLLVPLSLGVGQQTLSAKGSVKPRATHVAWGVVGLALVALVAWRVALRGGISF